MLTAAFLPCCVSTPAACAPHICLLQLTGLCCGSKESNLQPSTFQPGVMFTIKSGAGCCCDGPQWCRQNHLPECPHGHCQVWHHFGSGVGEWASHEDVTLAPDHGLCPPGVPCNYIHFLPLPALPSPALPSPARLYPALPPPCPAPPCPALPSPALPCPATTLASS